MARPQPPRRSTYKPKRVPLRPCDLRAKSPPPREPSTPAERLVAALLDGRSLGCESLKAEDRYENVSVHVMAERIPGEVEDIFQDPSTYKLHLKLRPCLPYVKPLCAVIAEFVGEEGQRNQPTWLRQLVENGGCCRNAKRVRHYEWVFVFASALFNTPDQDLGAYLDVWAKILQYMIHVKERCERVAYHRRVVERLSVCSRARAGSHGSASDLVAGIAALSLRETAHGGRCSEDREHQGRDADKAQSRSLWMALGWDEGVHVTFDELMDITEDGV